MSNGYREGIEWPIKETLLDNASQRIDCEVTEMRSSGASAIKIGYWSAVDEFEQSAMAIAMHVIPRTKQPGVEGGSSWANAADALHAFTMNVLRCFALVLGIMYPFHNGLSAPNPPLVPRND